MSYQPVGHHNTSGHLPAHLDNIELETRYDPGQHQYASPAGDPLDNLSKHDGDSKYDDDRKPLFRSTSKRVPEKNWPVEAQHVATMTPLRAAIAFFDAVLASTPIMFIALALTAARLDGKEISDYGERLQEALLISPTIFPLIFAALMGRFFRHLGVYLAERGTTLGRLEQLIGCQSVFTAIERQITLRSWSIIGLLSILVWLLSPVGGQSALRLFGQERQSVSSMGMVRYLDPGSVKFSAMEGASSVNSARATFTSIFLAALLSSSKYQNTSMDLWGNIKIPMYSQIASYGQSEWKSVIGEDGNNATYGSLIGVPVVGVPSEGISNFSIKARQFNVTCESNKLVPQSRNESTARNRTSTWDLIKRNVTGQAANNNWPRPIQSISLVDEDNNITNNTVAACNVDFFYLESQVSCNGTSCGVTRMRKLNLLGDGYTDNNDIFTRGNIITNLLNNLANLDTQRVASPTARGSTNAEKWMANPDNFIGTRFDNVQLYKLDPDTFATRLSILFNTFYQSTYATTALAGNFPANLTQTGVLMSDARGLGSNLTFNGTQANITQEATIVYRTNWKWFSALLVCSIILLVASYAGLILKYITLAPDIIGYASTLTVLNPYCPTPTGGTTLHGLERAAILHEMPVRIGDVCPNEPVGAIALAKNDGGRVMGLDRRRLYI